MKHSTSLFRSMLWVIAVSGLCSLIYQIAWLRLLRQIFGASTAASAAVVAIFMGGLGLGGHLFGRRTASMAEPLRVYARLELGIALSAALSPLFVALAKTAYLSTGGVFTLGTTLGTILRLVLAVLVLGVPTVLMGGTLPVVAQALERARDLGRRRIAWLYGVNTMGAVCGAVAGNFVLLEAFGIHRTLWIGAALNLLLVLVARRLAGSVQATEPDAPDPAAADKHAGDPSPVAGNGGSAASLRLLLPMAAFVGAVFFLMELVWYRMLGPILGGSTYTMGLILAVALAGIALGGLLYALDRESRRPTVATLALTCALEALFLGLPFMLGDSLALFAGNARYLSGLGFPGLVLSWCLVAAMVVLPASIVAGYQFPVLVGLLGSGRDGAGRDMGLAYAWNTGGAIVGSLAGGLILIPFLGAPALWRLTTLFLALAAALLILSDRRSSGRVGTAGTAALACGLVAALGVGTVAGPTAFWRHEPIGAGRMASDIADQSSFEAYRRSRNWSLKAEADGVESSIALSGFDDPALIVNGKSDGATFGDANTTIMSGLIGSVLHGEPRRALVIGLGIGTTAGWFGTVPSVETVDVVELEPAVIEATRPLGPATFHVLDNPKTRMHLGDGREFILTQDATWDLIFSEPSNPYRAGVADLFSEDFYRAAKHRLTEGGLFLQWLQGYEIDPPLIETVLAALSREFGAVEVWVVGPADLLLVASREPIRHDFDRAARLLDEPAYAEGMRLAWGVSGLPGFYSGFVAGPALAKSMEPHARRSTDDRPSIEFGFARSVGRRGLGSPIPDLQRLARSIGAAAPPGLDAELARRVADARRLRAFTVSAPMGQSPNLADLPPRELAWWNFSYDNFAAGLEAWHGMEPAEGNTEPVAEHYVEKVFLAYAYAEQGSEDARPWIEKVRAHSPLDADFLEGRLLFRQGKLGPSVALLRGALLRMQEDPWLHSLLKGKLETLVGEAAVLDPRAATALFEALWPDFAAYTLDLERTKLLLKLLDQPHLRAQCVPYFEDLEPDVFWREDFLSRRADCYGAAGHPSALLAERELARFVAQQAAEFAIPDTPSP